MSRENVELAYRATDAFNRRDLDAVFAVTHPDVEFTPFEVAVEGGEPYRGHDGVRTWWEDSFAVLPDLTVEIDGVRDLGDMVVVGGHLCGKGASSGASFERTLWMAEEWRDKRVVWWHAFQSEAEALEAVGLRE